jgi:hypothetical protein
VAVVRKRSIPTERPQLVGEVSANLLPVEVVALSAQRIPTAVNFGFLGRSRYFFIQVLLSWPHEAEWTPFQTPCFSENLVGPGIEPGISGSS